VSRGMVFIDTLTRFSRAAAFAGTDAETNESPAFDIGSTNEAKLRTPGGVRSSITCSKTAIRTVGRPCQRRVQQF